MEKIQFRQCDATNYRTGRRQEINYIVVHYTGNDGDTAKANADYFANNAGLEASSHYFVDEREVWQSVKEGDTAWHCGTTGVYRHPLCRNDSSLGIELCSRRNTDGVYYFMEETLILATELIRELMSKYNITVSNVLRHYDVTGKLCPAPFTGDTKDWTAFKMRLTPEKALIQERCGFSYPEGVWELLDTHPYAGELYRKWAGSYM